MIKNVLFDLDDTIFDFGTAEHIALSRTFDKLGIRVTKDLLDRYSQVNSACWEELEHGLLTLEEVQVERFRRLFTERCIACNPKTATDTYEGFLAVGHYYVEGAEETLFELKGRYRLYVASNGTADVQRSRIKSAGIAKLFDGIFISEDLGYFKPDVKFYERFFSKIPDFRKEETVMVGDRTTSDIRGGINAGIKTVWFNPNGTKNNTPYAPTAEIRELKELPSLLKNL